jgi:hypothetical protein
MHSDRDQEQMELARWYAASGRYRRGHHRSTYARRLLQCARALCRVHVPEAPADCVRISDAVKAALLQLLEDTLQPQRMRRMSAGEQSEYCLDLCVAAADRVEADMGQVVDAEQECRDQEYRDRLDQLVAAQLAISLSRPLSDTFEIRAMQIAERCLAAHLCDLNLGTFSYGGRTAIEVDSGTCGTARVEVTGMSDDQIQNAVRLAFQNLRAKSAALRLQA